MRMQSLSLKIPYCTKATAFSILTKHVTHTVARLLQPEGDSKTVTNFFLLHNCMDRILLLPVNSVTSAWLIFFPPEFELPPLLFKATRLLLIILEHPASLSHFGAIS